MLVVEVDGFEVPAEATAEADLSDLVGMVVEGECWKRMSNAGVGAV